MLDAARDAFTQGLQVAATVSGALVVAAAVMVARLLWHERAVAAAAQPATG